MRAKTQRALMKLTADEVGGGGATGTEVSKKVISALFTCWPGRRRTVGRAGRRTRVRGRKRSATHTQSHTHRDSHRQSLPLCGHREQGGRGSNFTSNFILKWDVLRHQREREREGGGREGGGERECSPKFRLGPPSWKRYPRAGPIKRQKGNKLI